MKTNLLAILALCLAASGTARATVVLDSMNDTTYEEVYNGYNGSGENLSQLLAGYVDPITHQATPITRPNGQALVVGDVTRGENPALSDQLQVQRFLVTGQDATLKLSYLGVGQATYKSILGVYTYSASANPLTAPVHKTPLFVQNVDAKGLEVTFTVPKDHYFGFYLVANGYKNANPSGYWFTENFRNSDNAAGRITDHFLAFQTNRGLLLAIEDLPYDCNSHRLGDQDYEDLLLGSLTYSNGTPIGDVPEPASLALLGLGAMLIGWKRRPARA